MPTITSKQRVLAALNHEEPDRVPLDIGGINNTSMHAIIEKKLKEQLNLEDHGTTIKATSLGVVVPDSSIVDYFGSDTCSIYINETQPWIKNDDGTFTDMWQIGYKYNHENYYYDMCKHPLEHVNSVEELDDYEFPEPTEYMLEGLEERLEANADKCCVLEGLREPMVGLPSWLRRNDNFYVDLLLNVELCDALHEKILNYYKKLIDFIMSRIGDRIDVVKVADDMGAQNSLLFSPETYRARIKPYQAGLYGYIKEKYNKKILLHSCGAIRPIIGDLIEIGVDAINPVQISAAGMDPESLKKEFGDKITFWGGGIDTQQVLPFATPKEIKEHVKKNLLTFKPNGGYVFATVHNIQHNVPIENVLALYEAYKQYASY